MPRFPVVSCCHCWHFLCHDFKLIVACGLFVSKTSIWLVLVSTCSSFFLCPSLSSLGFLQTCNSILFILCCITIFPQRFSAFLHIFQPFFRLLRFWLSKWWSEMSTVLTVTTYWSPLVSVFVYKLIAMVFMCSLSAYLVTDQSDCVKIICSRIHVGHNGR